MAKLTLYSQAIYYLVTGVWPFISMASFQALTGPKVDGWLVKMVGALVTVIGGVLLMAGVRRRVTPEIKVLSISSTIAFMGIDVAYVARQRISPIYLADALVQVFILLGWLIARLRNSYIQAPFFPKRNRADRYSI